MIKKLICYFKGHSWTSAAMQGKKPTEEQMRSVKAFEGYMKMYCGRCGYVSKLNKPL